MKLPAPLLMAIEKYLAGESGPEEDELVNVWYSSFDDGEIEIPEEISRLREKVGGRIWQRLTGTINEREPVAMPQKSLSALRRIMTAAAVLILLLAGKFLMPTAHVAERIPAQPSTKDIAPGGNKAILTLSDGSTIVLDSAHAGLLAHQGATSVSKPNSGKLTYRVDPKAAVEPVTYNTISTPRGGQFQITLPDGTDVWLNAASSLRYPTRFEGKQRTVELSGEAYFEVAKNASRPFIINMADHQHGDSLRIQVLGTSFNINGYEDDGTIKTTLVEGAVKLTRKKDSNLMSPGEQTETESSGGFRTIRHADIEEALAWKNGLFKYNSTNLQIIMRQISRWYDVDIAYAGKANEEFFSGSVPRSENVSSILHKLALTNTVHFTIDGKTIRVERVE